MWQEPIYDRTQADVDYADENRGSIFPNKGARNATDLNRISGNYKHLREELVNLGMIVPEMESRDDWLVMSDDVLERYDYKPPEQDVFPRRSDIEKIKSDMQSLANVGVANATPPDLPYTHYEKLNDLERFANELQDIIERIKNNKDLGWAMGIAHIGLYTSI